LFFHRIGGKPTFAANARFLAALAKAAIHLVTFEILEHDLNFSSMLSCGANLISC